MDNQGLSQVDEYKNEITRYEMRLTSIRHEVEELEHLKKKLHQEASEAMKNTDYLKDLDTRKQEEIDRKGVTIHDLNNQIMAKQSQFDHIQQEVGTLSLKAEALRAEKQVSEQKIAEHKEYIRSENERLHEKRQVVDENHRYSDEKRKKIEDFLKNLS